MAAWSYVVLEDIHPLYGGFRIGVTATNDVWSIVVGGGAMQGQRFHAKLPPEAFRDLERILAAHPPRARDARGSGHRATAEESILTVTHASPAGRIVSQRMSRERVPELEALERFLGDVSSMVAKNTSPIDHGRWDDRLGFVSA